MADATNTNVEATPATPATPDAAPPDGYRWKKKDGKVVLGDNGKPIAVKKKKGKKKGSKYSIADGKLRSATTPDFIIGVHGVLKETDFNDPLDFYLWKHWYYSQLAAKAEKEADALRKLGSTAEERSAAKEDMLLFQKLAERAAARKGTPNAERFAALLGETFAAVSIE